MPSYDVQKPLICLWKGPEKFIWWTGRHHIFTNNHSFWWTFRTQLKSSGVREFWWILTFQWDKLYDSAENTALNKRVNLAYLKGALVVYFNVYPFDPCQKVAVEGLVPLGFTSTISARRSFINTMTHTNPVIKKKNKILWVFQFTSICVFKGPYIGLFRS